jgi:hypothetical protein
VLHLATYPNELAAAVVYGLHHAAWHADVDPFCSVDSRVSRLKRALKEEAELADKRQRLLSNAKV